jgi:hypothetical protein
MPSGSWFNILQGPSDVDKTSAVNGDVLVYDDSIYQWKPTQITTFLFGTFLKLNQTVVQHIINGAPQFDEGITIKKDKFIYLDGT